ncbi:MAG: hypothetical protein RBT78_13360, partial [Kiritimatiellia bacterium]|nr:hypothetical protein [Kiritimatiellia bacterium]
SGMRTTLAQASVRTADGVSAANLKRLPGVRIEEGEVVLAYAPAREISAFAPMAKADAAQKWHGSDYWTGSEEWARVGRNWLHPGHAVDVARTFVAPADGRVSVSGTVRKLHLDGDGVKVSVLHKGKILWSAELEGKDGTGKEPALKLDVKKGDTLRFIVNRNGSHSCDTTGWDPVVAYEGGIAYRASEGFSDKQEANNWRYEFSGGPAAQTSQPVVYGVGKDFKLYKGSLDTAASFPAVIVSDGNKEDGFIGYVIARDSSEAWTLTQNAGGLKMAGAGAAVVARYDGTWIEGLKLLAELSGVGTPPRGVRSGSGEPALPALSAAIQAAYTKAVAGVPRAPEFDLFLLAVSEWVQDDGLFGGGDEKRLAECAKEQAERTEQITGKPGAPSGTGWGGYLRARLLKRAALLSDPRLAFGELLFCTRRNPSWNHEVAQYFGWRQRPGGSLFALEKPGLSLARRDLLAGKLPQGNILEPRLSYDAKKILFSFVATDGALDPRTLPCNETSTNHHYYHLYELGADGTGLRQITRDIYDDLMPEWLPDGGIAFVSTRRRATSRCFWWGYSDRWHSYTVFRMNPDGSEIRQLSWNDVNDWFPAVANSGHLLFARWDYIDRDAVTHQNLWSMRPDGTNPMAVWGNETPKPHCTFQAKAIPGSGKVVCVASAHHAITGGPVMLIDPAVHNNSEAAVTRLTPGHYPEAERGPNNEWYNAPWPLAEDLFLVAYSRDPLMYEPARHNPDYALGLYVLDARGNRELLYREGLLGATCPTPLASRPVPPVLPSVSNPLLAKRGLGEMFLSDVYEGMPNAERGTIRKIRVVQVFPKTTRDSMVPRIGVAGEENTRAILGETSVEADGSARFLVPAGKPILLQVLDADGFAYRTMRSSTSLMPGERVSCVGCHENKMAVSAAALKVTAAMKRPAAELTPTPESGRPYGFVEQVQPLFDAKCVSCHGDQNPKGGIALTRTLRGAYTASYDSLCYTTNSEGKRVRRLSKKSGRPLVTCYPMRNQIQVTPEGGEDGARGSGLVQMLKAGHGEVRLTPGELRRIGTWIDMNAVFYGVYEPEAQLAMQREGKPVPMPEIQ